MCFSATASFIAGSALSAIGVVTIKKTKRKAEIPFAMIPLLFGIQQIIEGVVWLSFGSSLLNIIATYAYSLFSHVLIFYFAATCISSLFSSHKIINVFGIIALLSAAVAYGFYAESFISVWCFFAGILSVIILLYFYYYNKSL